MLQLPKFEIERLPAAERAMVDKTIAWLQGGNAKRDPRIHASDLLDPRKAYWNRQHKEEIDERMAGNFMTGKVLHAFFNTMMDGKVGLNIEETDDGGTWDEDLGITYSSDYCKPVKTKTSPNGIPYELKTSRAMREQTTKDLGAYLEQLFIYMAGKRSLVGRLLVYRINAEDRKKGYGTYPQYRAYEVSWDAKAMNEYREKQIKNTVKLLSKALKTKKKADIAKLPLCREWKCGKKNCGHFALCKPEGRYTNKRFQ
jgi:hypothetical protein